MGKHHIVLFLFVYLVSLFLKKGGGGVGGLMRNVAEIN